MARKSQVKPDSARILDYSEAMSQYERESLAAEAELATDAPKRGEQGNRPTKT